MRYLVTGKEMKAIDRKTIEGFGIPSMVLMERAALSVAKEAKKLLKPEDKIWAVCGKGNNGADGIAAARILTLWGYETVILLPDEEEGGSAEFLQQLSIAKKLSIPVFGIHDFLPGRCDMILDAVFGIGLSREVEGTYKELLEFINRQTAARVVAVDIPSGVDSDTGKLMGPAVKADVTVTFGEEKLGQALYPGRQFCGTLHVADIGFPAAARENGAKERYALAYDTDDLAKIPARPAYSNKGTFGKVLVIGGAKNMAGAAYFSALAAYRTGAGLVKVMTVEENREIIQERLPEAVLTTFDVSWAREFPADFKEYIREQMETAGVIVLGPGLGRDGYAKTLVECALSEAYVPIVLDADAINLAAEHEYLTGYFTENIIITPHLAEMARLTGQTVAEIREDLIGTARSFSEQYGMTCVLKDAATVTARKDGRLYVNPSGSSAMAKGGSGDVLSGTIAGLLAVGMEECEAASFGVYLHGLAGELAGRKKGLHSVLAGEIADCLGEVLHEAV